MDHALRTISFIADIADVLVVMVRRYPPISSDDSSFSRQTALTKLCCHVFETSDVCIYQCLTCCSTLRQTSYT